MENKEPALLTNNPMVDRFYDNTQSSVIRITDDKLKVILLENKDSLTKRNDYIAPLTLLVSIILTFCTTDFKDFLNVSADAWKGLYLSLVLASIVWLIYELRKISKKISIDELITKIRNQKSNEEIAISESYFDGNNYIGLKSAVYGVDNNIIDVTNRIRHLLSNGTFDILVSNELGGDPAPGRVKILRVECTINGRNKSISVKENDTLRIQ